MLNVATMRRRNSADNKIATRILFIQRLRLQETMHPHKSYELESIQTSLKFTGFRTIACTKTYQKIIFAQQAWLDQLLEHTSGELTPYLTQAKQKSSDKSRFSGAVVSVKSCPKLCTAANSSSQEPWGVNCLNCADTPSLLCKAASLEVAMLATHSTPCAMWNLETMPLARTLHTIVLLCKGTKPHLRSKWDDQCLVFATVATVGIFAPQIADPSTLLESLPLPEQGAAQTSQLILLGILSVCPTISVLQPSYARPQRPGVWRLDLAVSLLTALRSLQRQHVSTARFPEGFRGPNPPAQQRCVSTDSGRG